MREYWTQDEKNKLIQHYPQHGGKYCANLLSRTYKAVRGQAFLLGLRANTRWTTEDEVLLVKYYTEYGTKYCSEILNRSSQSIQKKAFALGLTCTPPPDWNSQEVDILRQYYPTHGVKYCCGLLNKSYSAIVSKASKSNICTDTRNGLIVKQILKRTTNNRVVSLCKVHGETPHYLKKNGKISMCVMCKSIRSIERTKTNEGRVYSRKMAQKFRSTPMGKFTCRLRISLRNALRSKNIRKTRKGCFRLLPYSPNELVQHLEGVRLSQDNQCQMCFKSYDINPWTIDHIVPIKTAKTEEDVLKLFDLNNLSLLCRSCNTSKGTKVCDYHTGLTPKQPEVANIVIKRVR